MQWEWDPQKDRQNRQKHGISFANAVGVFDDPFQIVDPDPHPDEERFKTIGEASGVILVVVHTRPLYDPRTNDETGRIISARKVEREERRRYEAEVFRAYRGANRGT